MSTLKTMVLMVGLTLILIWAGGALGGRSGMTMALMFALMMNLFAYWFSDKIVLKMYRAQEVREHEAPELYSIVRRLAQKAEIPMPRVYIINEDQPNAFATGRNPANSAYRSLILMARLSSVLTKKSCQNFWGLNRH